MITNYIIPLLAWVCNRIPKIKECIFYAEKETVPAYMGRTRIGLTKISTTTIKNPHNKAKILILQSKYQRPISKYFETKPCQKQCQKQGPGIPAEAPFLYFASSSRFASRVYSLTACSYVSQSFSSRDFTTHSLMMCNFFIINSFFMLSPFCPYRLPAPHPGLAVCVLIW